MSVFKLYFELGLSHISDLKGYDHILFLITLCAVYSIRQWKNILVLITGFTLGHCTTLVLATFNFIKVNSDLIEFLIPVTILVTAITNITLKNDKYSKPLQVTKYCAAVIFGLIHGLGFSSYLKSLLGSESNILKPLLAFNIGIELGQIFIVSIILVLSILTINFFKLSKKEWGLILSGAGLGVSLILILERFPY